MRSLTPPTAGLWLLQKTSEHAFFVFLIILQKETKKHEKKKNVKIINNNDTRPSDMKHYTVQLCVYGYSCCPSDLDIDTTHDYYCYYYYFFKKIRQL